MTTYDLVTPTELNQALATRDATIATVATKVSALEGRETAVEGRATTLEGQVSGLQGQVSTLQTQLSQLNTTFNAVVAAASSITSRVQALETAVAALQQASPSNLKQVAVPTAFQLFGPVQQPGRFEQPVPTAWGFPGSALSASTKSFWFGLEYPAAIWARLVLVWAPRVVANKVRLVSMDSGPTNIVQMGAIIDGVVTPNPIVSGIAITNELNQLVAAKAPEKMIGFQVIGDGVNPMTIYEARLEILWRAMAPV